MSRLKNFSRNIATSYLQLGVNAIYSLVSVPLILHWLPKAEFGLWAVLVQMLAYVSIIDLGMTSAVARLLVDHKDDRHNGNYGSLVKTAFGVSLTQGLIILVAVALGAPLLANLMRIPPEHQDTFISLLRIQGCFTAFTFSLRPLGLMLYAHQRMDLQSYSEMLTLAVLLGLLVCFLNRGYGIYSFIYANGCTLLVGPIFLFWNCWRIGVLPKAGEWGHASWKMFREVFNYGKDVFLLNLGSQLIMTSQTIVVSRTMGLERAAVWSVGTKLFNLVVPLVARPNGAAMPSMFEMQVRGEKERLQRRFRAMVLLTASLGAFCGGSFAMCNSLFVQVWTAGKIAWLPLNDMLLGTWLFILSMQTTHSSFVAVTKQIRGMRYIFFAEGCTFFIVSLLLAGRWGVPGMVLTSICCSLLFSYQYSLRRSHAFFHCSLVELAIKWVLPSLKLAAAFGILTIIVSLLDQGLPVLWRLIIHGSVATLIGGLLFLRLGLPKEMITEATTRLPQSAAKWLQFVSAR